VEFRENCMYFQYLLCKIPGEIPSGKFSIKPTPNLGNGQNISSAQGQGRGGRGSRGSVGEFSFGGGHGYQFLGHGQGNRGNGRGAGRGSRGSIREFGRSEMIRPGLGL
jgi:hypothetical protein